MERLRACAIALAGAVAWLAAQPASAVDIDAAFLRDYGGTYAARCADPASPRLTVAADRLVIDIRGQTITGRQVQAAASFLGPEPPPGYRMALLSQLRSGKDMTFIVYRDAAGLYIRVDGDRQLVGALAKSLGTQTYRDCDAARARRDGAADAADARQERAAAAAAQDPNDPLKRPGVKAAYLKALGPRAKERWLATLDGVAGEPKTVRVAGADYGMVSVCKPHDCADNNVVVLFARSGDALYGKVLLHGNDAALIGAPPPAVAAELERLWKAEWRQGR